MTIQFKRARTMPHASVLFDLGLSDADVREALDLSNDAVFLLRRDWERRVSPAKLDRARTPTDEWGRDLRLKKGAA